MPVILSLETSADVCSVALHKGQQLLGAKVIREPQSHAARLAPLIDETMRESGHLINDLQAVAVSAGPGSYTGLRIGASTAKGLCYAMELPLITVGTLDILAFQGQALNATGALLCPMIDARRMEVYCMVTDPELNPVEPVAAKVIEPASFSELLAHQRMLFFGSGAAKCRAVIQHPNALFIDDVIPVASALGEMAQVKFAAAKFENLVQFTPYYFKEFAARKVDPGV